MFRQSIRLLVAFVLVGALFLSLDSVPQFQFTEAVSLSIEANELGRVVQAMLSELLVAPATSD